MTLVPMLFAKKVIGLMIQNQDQCKSEDSNHIERNIGMERNKMHV